MHIAGVLMLVTAGSVVHSSRFHRLKCEINILPGVFCPALFGMDHQGTLHSWLTYHSGKWSCQQSELPRNLRKK